MTTRDSLTLTAAGTAANLRIGLGAMLVGLLLLLGTGFAAPMAIHNATHDTRHAFGLPCH